MKYSSNVLFFVLTCLFLLEIPHNHAKTHNKNVVIDRIYDVKDFKKLIRTKTNVLVCFTSSVKQSYELIKVFKEAAEVVKGQGTMVLVDCSGDAKKMCKKLKVSPEPYILKHYKDGEFSKDYDRRETTASIVNFMRDPAGDLPWEEDVTAEHIIHIADSQHLLRFLKKESRPIMIMFYAPWCGFCKTLKPEYATAAETLQGDAVLAAIDVNRPENSNVRTQFNITGFPTLLYFENGVMKYHYEGENNKNGIVQFMRNPQAPPVKVKEPEWSDVDSEVVHLTTTSFDPVIKEEASVLIMFYAPWCGHCKRMKPEYEKAANQMKNDGITGMLAAVDATKESSLASRFSIKGYPTVKYFMYGEVKFDVNVRDAPKIVEFMQNPQEPPPPPPPEVPWAEEKSEVVHLNEETFKPFLKKKKHVLVIFYAPWCGHCKRSKPEFTQAAETFKDDPKVEFAAVDCTTQQNLCATYDVKGYPTFKYFSYFSKVVKSYNGGRTKEEFIAFMTHPDEAKPPMPKDDEWKSPSKDVLSLNNNSFKYEINSKEPVLVMFYAPWCTHCKQTKPHYIKAAEQLKSGGYKCKLAMIDCTEHPDIAERYDVAGFPTIKLFRNGKVVQDYKGKRTIEDFVAFMKSHILDKSEL